MPQNTTEKPHIVIVGAGIGGMTMAIELKRIGFSNFTIIEMASEVGGTWRDNIYPGCSSDVAAHLYSLSTDLNPDWTHSHAFQPDLQKYWVGLAHKYELYSNTIFNRKVVSADWDAKTQQYSILIEDCNNKTRTSLRARLLVSAIGPRQEYSATQKWIFRHVPFCLRAFRNFQYLRSELLYFLIFGSNTANHYVEQYYIKAHMRKVTPIEYLEQIIPSHPKKLGCKRIIYDTNYLASLARPNMSLVWDPIEAITEDGLAAVDVIIYSTGYVTDEYTISIKGSKQQTIAEYYEAQGGPTAYLGTTLPGFPNFFMISGANSSSGHTSVLFAFEVQAQYIIQMIKPVIAGAVSSLEITAEATETYNRDIQARLTGFVWTTCASWYRAGQTGKIHRPFPGPMALFWWRLWRPNWSHYKVQSATGLEPGRPWYHSSGILFGCFILGVAAALNLVRVIQQLLHVPASSGGNEHKSQAFTQSRPELSFFICTSLAPASPLKSSLVTSIMMAQLAPGSTLAVVSILAGYLLLIFGTQTTMRHRAPLRPKQLLQAHNIALSVVSLVLLVFMLEEASLLLRRVGVLDAMCAEESWTEKLDLYYRVNYALKYVELLDTLFIVLRKKRLTFLHVYHHSSAIILCYVQLKNRSTLSWVAITGNLFVHTILYYYYFVTGSGYRPWWKKHLTGLQILQFVVVGPTSLWALGVSQFSVPRKPCSVTSAAALVGTVTLTSHFFLFVELYFTTYIKNANAGWKPIVRQWGARAWKAE
ncbi:GNS1/SUR4 family-domain-containing protein [Mycena epipterygia]|nr:GNS1/SUR4 family-domain-containing protein [Mycena epipterygia]